MSDSDKPAVMEPVDEPQQQEAAPKYEPPANVEEGGQAPALPQKSGPGGMMMLAPISLPDAVLAPFNKRVMILRLVQMGLALLGGILTIVPVSYTVFNVSVNVTGPAWPLVAAIFTCIWGGLFLFSLRKYGIAHLVSPIPLAIEFVLIIFIFSGAIQSAQWAASIGQLITVGTFTGSNAVAAIGAVFMWLAFVSFILTAFLIFQIMVQLQRLNQVDYFARPASAQAAA